MHILPFLYPFIWQWTLGLLLLLVCRKWRCFEHVCADSSWRSCFLILLAVNPEVRQLHFLKHQNLLLVFLSCSSVISSSYFSPGVFLKPFNIPEI